MWPHRYGQKANISKTQYLVATFAIAVMIMPAVGGATSVIMTHVNLPTMTPAVVKYVPAATCSGTTTTTSSNWGGYAVQSCLTSPSSKVVTKVVGTWVEPTAKCTKTAYAAFWVGIDGYSSSSVEQLGTDSDCNGATPSYYAWYEMYPANPVTLSMSIKPGNTITASVTYNSAGKFVLALKDVTTGKSFSVTKSLSSAARSSAEWIVEAPSSSSGVLPLADFGTVTFTSCSATISGVTGPIQTSTSKWQAAEMNIVGSATEETTSSLTSGGNGFSGTWVSS
jgi:hypothetical protein